MALSKEKKKVIVNDLTKELTRAPSVVFVSFHGLSVSETSTLRRALAVCGAHFQVVKKSLARKVFAALAPDGESPEMSGELALSWGGDPVSPAKEIHQFTRGLEEKIKILGGIFERRFLAAEDMKRLARTPSKEVLYGRLVGTLNAPASAFARALSGVTASMVRVLGGISQKKIV